MTGSRIILLGLVVILGSWASASSSYYSYPGNFPIVFFSDFTYIPTDYGYKLSYRTQAGVRHEELGIIEGEAIQRNNDIDIPSSDTLGSSKKLLRKMKDFPLKNRKVSDKLLKSLTG